MGTKWTSQNKTKQNKEPTEIDGRKDLVHKNGIDELIQIIAELTKTKEELTSELHLIKNTRQNESKEKPYEQISTDVESDEEFLSINSEISDMWKTRSIAEKTDFN